MLSIPLCNMFRIPSRLTLLSAVWIELLDNSCKQWVCFVLISYPQLLQPYFQAKVTRNSYLIWGIFCLFIWFSSVCWRHRLELRSRLFSGFATDPLALWGTGCTHGMCWRLGLLLLSSFSQGMFSHLLLRDSNNRYLRETRKVAIEKGEECSLLQYGSFDLLCFSRCGFAHHVLRNYDTGHVLTQEQKNMLSIFDFFLMNPIFGKDKVKNVSIVLFLCRCLYNNKNRSKRLMSKLVGCSRSQKFSLVASLLREIRPIISCFLGSQPLLQERVFFVSHRRTGETFLVEKIFIFIMRNAGAKDFNFLIISGEA